MNLLENGKAISGWMIEAKHDTKGRIMLGIEWEDEKVYVLF